MFVQEIIDDGDEKLEELRKRYGEAIYTAMTTALVERNEYFTSLRYPVLELWNFEVKRKASLKEGLAYILVEGRVRKQRRTTGVEAAYIFDEWKRKQMRTPSGMGTQYNRVKVGWSITMKLSCRL